MNKRTVELAYCFSDGTWQAEKFVQIPANTPDEKVEEYAIEEMKSLLALGYSTVGRPKGIPEIVRMWMYNSGDDTMDETEIPDRLRFMAVLEIDGIDGIENKDNSPAQVVRGFLNTLGGLLQREPYGWGATVIGLSGDVDVIKNSA